MRGLIRVVIGVLAGAVLVMACTVAVFWYAWSSNLPYIGVLEDYRPPTITEIYGRDHRLIGRFWEERRILVQLDELPPYLIRAFVAAEDARFFEHEGLDIFGIARAMINNVLAGRIEQGGSTITQQVARSLLLKDAEKTYKRKAREALLSLQIEKRFTKDRILFLYVNQIYLGHGAYGVGAAAMVYFNKKPRDLTLAESALLAGLPQAPSRYSPVAHLDRAKVRQRYVLERMVAEGYITRAEMNSAFAERLAIAPEEGNPFQNTAYFTEHVRRTLLDKYGKDLLYRGGLKVYTTLDFQMQEAATAALMKGLRELDKREGYRGPIRRLNEEEISRSRQTFRDSSEKGRLATGDLTEALVERLDDLGQFAVLLLANRESALLPLSRMRWARPSNPEAAYYAASIKRPSEVLSPGDMVLVRVEEKARPPFVWEVALEQEPEIQGALFCLEPETGKVRAMVGGRSFEVSQFNRAVQSRRQPGSAFKPIIYAAALDFGMSPADVILDAPYIAEETEASEEWKPKNYSEKFEGPTLLRTALAKSRNVITVKILRKIGVDYVIKYAANLGIGSPLTPDLSLALGSSGVSLMELTRAYCVFANGGLVVEPLFVERVEDRNGQILEENRMKLREAISKETAFIMTDLMKAVIQEGTGWRVRGLKRPAAGKTGTTNDLKDAWFIGYTPGLAAGVWVGYDDLRPMGKGETGSRAASPIWLDFMSSVLEGQPVSDFSVPQGVVFAKIDLATGLLAGPTSEQAVFQAFREGQEPKDYAPKPTAPKVGQFQQLDLDSER
jgi:penicillin-binding protein 1A